MAGEVPDNKLIKQSLAFRAKYKTKREDLSGGMRNLYAWQIVPHPMSSMGGEPIKPPRTKALAGDILSNGYDAREAHADCVVVEAALDGAGVPMTTFADHFRSNVYIFQDHYKDESVIGFAGLNHNSLNLTERNILKGMPGCNCNPPVASLAYCTCHAKPILEEHGGKLVYSMSKLREVDKDWRYDILGGRTWEVLSSDMDIEEPEAAGIIALVLSNRAVLATGHLEMMRTMTVSYTHLRAHET